MTTTRHSRKTPFGPLFLPVLAACVLVYFCFHALHGSYGLVARMELSREVARAKEKLLLLEGEKTQLERRVSLLRSESLDPDLVDEQARLSLNLLHPNEIIILRPSMEEESR